LGIINGTGGGIGQGWKKGGENHMQLLKIQGKQNRMIHMDAQDIQDGKDG
jgi:hypothetical protein